MLSLNASKLTTSAMADHIESASLALVNILGLAANVLVFVLFYRKPTLRTFSNGFVLGLSVCHMVQSVLQMPYVVIPGVLGKWVFGDVWCKISASLSICFSLSTAFSLLLIAIDRSYAVNSPLHYTMITTKKIITLQISGIWGLSLVMSSPPLFGFFRVEYRESWNTCVVAWYDGSPSVIAYSSVLLLCGFLLPLIKLCVTYRSMYVAARKNGATARIYLYRRKLATLKMAEEWRVLRTPLMVISSHIVSSLPLYLIMAVEAYLKIQVQRSSLITAVTLAVFSSSVINPYLYVFRNKTTKKELKKLFGSKKCRISNTRTAVRNQRGKSKDDIASNSSEDILPSEFRTVSFDNPTVRSWDVKKELKCSSPISTSENNLSRFGYSKRSSFVLTRLGNSSDTTLTSASSDSQDLSLQVVYAPKPKLIRQHSALVAYPDHI